MSRARIGPGAAGARAPLRISVVGHVNTGKTSLISTLARRSDLAVSDGRTTLTVQEITFSSRGEELPCHALRDRRDLISPVGRGPGEKLVQRWHHATHPIPRLKEILLAERPRREPLEEKRVYSRSDRLHEV